MGFRITASSKSRKLSSLIGTATTPSTREEWLARLAALLRPIFQAAGAVIPQNIRFSCGWPAGSRGNTLKAIGECWYPAASEDGHYEVFVSPAVGTGLEAAAVLLHELIHASLPQEAGHGPVFKGLATKLGLEGKMTATIPGEALATALAALCDGIGPYPHAMLRRGEAADKPKKQTTRMIKVVCPACEYTVRTTRRWLGIGVPTCCCGEEMVAETGGEDGDGDGDGE